MCTCASMWIKINLAAMLDIKKSAIVTQEAKNLGQKSPEVKNSGINGSTKRADVLQNFILKI